MSRIVLIIIAIVILFHGLIHLMGFVAYWKVAELPDLPYKTTLANNRWEVGDTGMKLFGFLWLAAAIGFVVAAGGLVTGQEWWQPLMLGMTALSLLIIGLDWEVAFRGGFVDIAILIAAVLVSRITSIPELFS